MMVVGYAVLEIRISWAQSLKDKRGVVKSVLQRTGRKFNVSVAEIDSQDVRQQAQLAAAVVGSSRSHVDRQLQRIIEFIEQEPRLEVGHVEIGWL